MSKVKPSDFVHPHSKKIGRPSLLSESQITHIVSSYATHTAKELSSTHGCSHWNIKKIWAKHGKQGKSHRRYAVDLTYFESIDSPDKAYFLGFIAADGCVRRPSRGPSVLSIRISSEDEEILIQFLKHLKSDIPVLRSCYTTPWKGVQKEASFINVISDKFCKDLESYNVVERKTRCYEPAPLPDDLKPHFMRGYFDGDGTVYKVGGKSGAYPSHYRFAVCVNENTGRYFQNYLEQKGIRSHLIEDKTSSIFQLRIADNLSKLMFVKLLYEASEAPCLQRKKHLIDIFMECCKESNAGLKG